MDSCHLLRPDWLWLLIALVPLVWLLGRRQRKAGSWRTVCDAPLLPYILQGRETKASRWPLLIVTLAGLLAILALSGPACEQREQPVFRDQSALVIALDLSRSMDATDIKPSRLIRARLKLIDILKQRQQGQTALIVYAAQAFTVSPLTDDTDTIISLISSLDSSMMPQQGSDSSTAIARAAHLLQQAGVPKGDILLITDGISDSQRQDTLKEINSYSHRVSVLGVGTHAGAPIALHDGGFLKDASGAIVIPKLDETPLKQLAQHGNGRYEVMRNDDSDIKSLLDIVIAEGDNKEAVIDMNTDQWREEGPWLLLLILPFAALGFRRGSLALFVLLIIPMPEDVYAADLQQIWLNQDQQAQQQLQQGNAKQAAALFNDPEWKAAAHYRAEQYQQSIDALQGINSAEALYNKGNALARLGKTQDALEAYDDALKLQPKHEDAKYNRDLLKQQQQQQQQENQQGDESQKDSAPNEDQQQQNQGQNQDQQSEQQSSDEQQGSQGEQQELDGEQQQAQQSEQENEPSEDKQQQAQQQNSENNDAEEQQANTTQELTETSENDIATEQWLRRIPDDPGGLMRRKFQYQYQQQSQQRNSTSEPW